MSKLRTDDVMERLRAHPLFRKVIQGVSDEEKKHIESTVVAFVDQLTDSLGTAAAHPKTREALVAAASGKSPVSGSVG